MRRRLTRSFTRVPRSRWLPILLLAWVAGSAASLALVPECASVNASPVAFDPGPRPSVSEPVRVERYRLPAVRSTSGETISFWDFVPAEFYIALGRTKQQVESMDLAEWDDAFVSWRALRRWDHRPFPFGSRGRAYRQIDWLFTIAREARLIEDDAQISMGGHAAIEIAVDPQLARYARILHEEPSPGTLWLMVASMFSSYRMQVPIPNTAMSTWMLDRHWHDFAAEPAPVRVSQNDALRRYLCSHPDVLYLTRRAERMQQSDDPAMQRRAIVDLSALDAYVADSIDDFGEFFAMITLNEHRDVLRQLVPAGEVDEFDQMIDTQGAAKAFLQMRQTVLGMVELEGEFGSTKRVWNRLPAHIRYVWPDRCLTQARYPTSSSPIFGTPWIFSAPCDAPPLTREQVYLRIQEGN